MMPVGAVRSICARTHCRYGAPAEPLLSDPRAASDLAGSLIGRLSGALGKNYDPGSYAMAVEIWTRLDEGLLTRTEAERFVSWLQRYAGEEAFYANAEARAPVTTGACCGSCAQGGPCGVPVRSTETGACG